MLCPEDNPGIKSGSETGISYQSVRKRLRIVVETRHVVLESSNYHVKSKRPHIESVLSSWTLQLFLFLAFPFAFSFLVTSASIFVIVKVMPVFQGMELG